MNRILYFIASIPLKSLLLSSGSHIVSCFSARAEIPFRLQGIFSSRAENPSPVWPNRARIYSSFARPGSAPIWGEKKGEFRDWTSLAPEASNIPNEIHT